MRSGTITALAFALAGLAGTASASIAPPPPPHVLYAEADVVVTGNVTEILTSAIRVEIDEVLKGGITETIDVGPISVPSCTPGSRGPPHFKAGEKVLVAARKTENGYRFVDHTLRSTRLDGDPHASLDLAREMLRLADVSEDERRAAMVGHMSSDEYVFVDAAVWFQFTELSSPEQSGAHVAGLLAALDAPRAEGRRAALRALEGLTPPEGVERVVELAESEDAQDVAAACAVLAHYDRDDTLDVVIRTAERRGDPFVLQYLGTNRRPAAVGRLRRALLEGEESERQAAVRAYQLRIETYEASDSDIDDLLEHVCSGGAYSNTYTLIQALSATRSTRAATALIDVVRDPSSNTPQLDVSYGALWNMSSELELEEVRQALIANADVFIRRIDDDGQRMYLCWVLGVIHTDDARAALERATKADPPNSNGDAWRTLRYWDER